MWRPVRAHSCCQRHRRSPCDCGHGNSCSRTRPFCRNIGMSGHLFDGLDDQAADPSPVADAGERACDQRPDRRSSAMTGVAELLGPMMAASGKLLRDRSRPLPHSRGRWNWGTTEAMQAGREGYTIDGAERVRPSRFLGSRKFDLRLFPPLIAQPSLAITRKPGGRSPSRTQPPATSPSSVRRGGR